MGKKEKRNAVLNLRIPVRVKRNLQAKARENMKTTADIANERLDIDKDYE